MKNRKIVEIRQADLTSNQLLLLSSLHEILYSGKSVKIYYTSREVLIDSLKKLKINPSSIISSIIL